MANDCFILWAIRNNDYSVEEKIEKHQKKISEKKYSLYGVNFSINRENLPPIGYIARARTKGVYYKAIIDHDHAEQYKSPTISSNKEHIPPEFGRMPWRTYLALNEIKILPTPLPLNKFIICSTGNRVIYPPERGYYVRCETK